jgi:hypothetical protein
LLHGDVMRWIWLRSASRVSFPLPLILLCKPTSNFLGCLFGCFSRTWIHVSFGRFGQPRCIWLESASRAAFPLPLILLCLVASCRVFSHTTPSDIFFPFPILFFRLDLPTSSSSCSQSLPLPCFLLDSFAGRRATGIAASGDRGYFRRRLFSSACCSVPTLVSLLFSILLFSGAAACVCVCVVEPGKSQLVPLV